MPILTCKNHLDLRWMTKPEAWSTIHGYTGARNIFFMGAEPFKPHSDKSGLDWNYNKPECQCKAHDLVLAPEDNPLHPIWK